MGLIQKVGAQYSMMGLQQSNSLYENTMRAFSHPKWNKKTRHLFKPTYFDNVNYYQDKNFEAKKKRFRYVTQDPLFFDYEKLYINGGIQPYIDKVRKSQRPDIPMNKRAYILYHMAKQGVRDPEVFALLEKEMTKDVGSDIQVKG